MSIPDSMKEDVDAMPASLRALLEAELAAGNEIVEIGHSFPAPPTGAYFKLAKPIITRERKSGDGFEYRARNSSISSGEITDAARWYYLIEPPSAESGGGDSGIVHGTSSVPVSTTIAAKTSSAQARFKNSTVLDYDKWHDGVGYDLQALREMSDEERKSTEAALIAQGLRDWRDVEALVQLGTPEAMNTVKAAVNHPDPEIRTAVLRFAPEAVSEVAKSSVLVELLETAKFFAGLGQALDQVATHHPPPVVEALLRGTLTRPGDAAVHFAAMLCFIHGHATEPFEMNQRDFFLRFNTENQAEREIAFCELCKKIGVDSARYLNGVGPTGLGPASVSEADYTVEVDIRGEMLTYCEPSRSAHVIWTFHGAPSILVPTLSNWYYPLGRRSEKMSVAEKQIILARIADYCGRHHRMSKLTFAE